MQNIYSLLLAVCLISTTSITAQINWQPTNGPEGCNAWHIYSNDNYAFYPGEYQLFRSADGLIWEALPMSNLWLMDLNAQKMAAFQNYTNSFGATDIRFVVSTDQGSSWSVGQLPPCGGFYSIGVCSHGIYGTDGLQPNIFRTEDDGLTWDTIGGAGANCDNIWIEEDQVYTSSYKKLWRLITNDLTWESIPLPVDLNGYITDVYKSGSVLICGTEYAIWSTKDNGVTWNKIATQINNYDGKLVSIGDRIYINAGTTHIMYTDDFGETWTKFPLTDYYLITEMATVQNRLLCAEPYRGITYLDVDNKELVPSNSGIGAAVANEINAHDQTLWAATGTGVYSYDMISKQWNNTSTAPIPTQPYQELKISPGGKLMVYETAGHTILVSNNAGTTWFARDLTQSGQGSLYINRCFWAGENMAIVDNHGYLLVSDNLGVTWNDVGVGVLADIYDMARLNNKYYAIGISNFIKSDNSGASWQPVTSLPPALNSPIDLHSSGDRLFASCFDEQSDNYRLFSTTDGETWKYTGDGLPPIHDVVEWGQLSTGDAWYFDKRYYLHKRSLGLYVSLDTCQTWLPVEAPDYSSMIMYDSILFKANHGVFRADLLKQYSATSAGFVYHDENKNGQYDLGENKIPNARIDLFEPGAWYPFWFTTTNYNGAYAILNLPNNQDTLRPNLNSPYISAIVPPFYVVNYTDNNRNFGIQFSDNITDGAIKNTHTSIPRPGFSNSMLLSLENLGTLVVNGSVGIKLDPKFTYSSANPAPASILNGDSLIWDIAQLNLFESRHILIRGEIDQNAPLGSVVKTTGTLTVNGSDVNLANNHFVTCDTVRGSYDPNEKRVDPAGGLTKAEIAAGKPLTYTIYFQNTGTFEADRVRITDKLDTALNWQTLRLLGASHEVSSFQLLPGGLLEVVFNHIALPDSNTNEPASHGFVQFSIERNKAFNANRKVSNQAAIYFDFNDPIFTNTVAIGIAKEPVTSSDVPNRDDLTSTLLVTPNPASSWFVADTRGLLRGAAELRVVDLNGRLCRRQHVSDCALPVRVSADLPAGFYLISITSEQGVMVGKVEVK